MSDEPVLNRHLYTTGGTRHFPMHDWRGLLTLINGNAYCGTISLFSNRRMRLVSGNCRWWDVHTGTSVILSFIIMQIQIDKCFFWLRISDHYLHFTEVHISCLYSYWLFRDCQNLLNCLSELLMAPGRRALTKGQWQTCFSLTPKLTFAAL